MGNNSKNILAFLCFILTCFGFQNTAQCAMQHTDAPVKIDNWKPVLSLNTPNTLIVSDVHGTLIDRRGRTINDQDWNSIKGNVLGFTSDNDPKSFDFGHGCVHSNGNQSFNKVPATIEKITKIIGDHTTNKIKSIVVVDDSSIILRLMDHRLKTLQECSGINLHFFQFCQSEESQKKAITENQSEGSLHKVLEPRRPSDLIIVSEAHPSPTASPSSMSSITAPHEHTTFSSGKTSPVLKPIKQDEEASTSCWSHLLKCLSCPKKSTVPPQ